MIVEKLDTEELEEFSFINPDLPGNKFLSITFTSADHTEFLKSSWSKVTSFPEACKKYIRLIV